MKKHGNIQMQVDGVRWFGSMNNANFEKNSKWQHCARCVYYLSEITTHTSNLKNTVLILIDLQSNPPKASTVRYRHAVLVKSQPFCTTLDLQLSFYRPLCYDSRTHCPLLQCLRTSAILTGTYPYFLVSSFKWQR